MGKVKDGYSLFIGRFQPLHGGHVKLIDTAMKEGKRILVALMDTPIDADNPFTLEERTFMFEQVFGDDIRIISIPPIGEVCCGRDVGWGIRRIHLDPIVESISATEIRKSQIEEEENG